MYILILGFILGAVLGSFTKVLADRSLTNRSFLGRSYCEFCKKYLKIPDLVPIFSYLFLKGRCRYCNNKLSVEYFLMEVVMGVLVALLFWFYFNNPSTLLYNIFFVAVLLAVFITDLRQMLVPDRIIIPALILSVFAKAFLLPDQFLSSVLASLIIGAFFLTLVFVTQGKGMGGGDIKLGSFIGISLGFPLGFLAIMLGFLIGAVFGIGALVLGKKTFKNVLPFAPFLVLGSILTIFWGKEILALFMF